MLRLRATMETTVSCDGGHGVLTWARSCKSQGPLTDVTAAHERFFFYAVDGHKRLGTIGNDCLVNDCARLLMHANLPANLPRVKPSVIFLYYTITNATFSCRGPARGKIQNNIHLV